MRVLLLGSAGMLARDLAAASPEWADVAAPSESEADITDGGNLEAILADLGPDVVINAAAYTNVDGAETDSEKAFLINGEAPGILGRATARFEGDVFVIHYGTDYVFSGATNRPYLEDNPAEPLGVYGASKLAGEQALASSGASYLTIRTQWLFGTYGKSFPRTMWERAVAGQPTRVVSDQTGRPTYSADLAAATWHLLQPLHNGQAMLMGAIHVANTGIATWYDVAQRVFDAAEAGELLSPCATEDYPTAAARPSWSVLDTERYDSLAGAPLPTWQDAIDRFLKIVGTETR